MTSLQDLGGKPFQSPYEHEDKGKFIVLLGTLDGWFLQVQLTALQNSVFGVDTASAKMACLHGAVADTRVWASFTACSSWRDLKASLASTLLLSGERRGGQGWSVP